MFERISIPTPFQVGPVNAYLAGRTLIDPGPESEEAWSTLLDELEARDLTPEDVEQVLITHPHPDHFGLANRLHDTGASIAASEPAATIIEDFSGRLSREQDFFVPFLQRHGVSEGTATTVTELPETFLQYAPDSPVDRVLAPGDVIEAGGVDLEIIEAEGHAAGEVVFAYDDPGSEESVGVVGDNVLGDITPNPFLLPPSEEGGQRPRVLPRFNDSLRNLREEGFDRIKPGHREEITDPAGRIDEILAAHEERTENVYDLVEGPTTAVEVMEGLFGDLPATEYFSGMSEAVGHLDVLEEREKVTRHEEGGMIVYEWV